MFKKTKIKLAREDAAIIIRGDMSFEVYMNQPEDGEEYLLPASNMVAVLSMAVADQKSMDLLNARFEKLAKEKKDK